MNTLDIPLIALSAIFALEFLLFALLMIRDIRIYYHCKLSIVMPQKLFYAFMFMICTLRLINAICNMMMYEARWLWIMYCFGNLITFYIYSLILYLW